MDNFICECCNKKITKINNQKKRNLVWKNSIKKNYVNLVIIIKIKIVIIILDYYYIKQTIKL